MKRKVSVIIPMYNSEEYISKCVDSVINQTLREIEIILVDDGSTDKTLEICNEYAILDDRIKIIKQKNKGVSSARNKGINFATGEYVTFVDSDDFIENNMLEILYGKAIKNNCNIVISGMNLINKNNENNESYNINNSKIYKKHEAFKLFYYNQAPFSPNYAWGKLIKKSILDKVKFREDIFLMEDALFCMESFIECKNSIMYVNKHLYNYIQRKGSASKSFNKKRISSFYALEELINLARRIDKNYEQEFLKVYSKLILGILQDIIYYDFYGNKEEYFKISKALNKKYFNNLRNREINKKNKIHLSIIKISPKLYKKALILLN